MIRLIAGSALLLSGVAAEAQVNPSFAPCAACHSVKPKENRIGPSLHRIAGAKKAAVAGYNYSPALKQRPGQWTDAELHAFIKAPRAHVPGTKMFYAGMPDAAKRAQLIAYLKTLK